MKIVATAKKIIKANQFVNKGIGAIASGAVDYAKKSNAANMQAEKNVSSSFGKVSQEDDAGMVGEETQRIKKQQGISFRSSVRSKLGL